MCAVICPSSAPGKGNQALRRWGGPATQAVPAPGTGLQRVPPPTGLGSGHQRQRQQQPQAFRPSAVAVPLYSDFPSSTSRSRRLASPRIASRSCTQPPTIYYSHDSIPAHSDAAADGCLYICAFLCCPRRPVCIVRCPGPAACLSAVDRPLTICLSRPATLR